MGFNFPNSPVQGQLYEPVSGYSYVFQDGVWRVVESVQIGTALPMNRLVNPAMQISQENGTAAGSVSGYWPADMFTVGYSGGMAMSSQRRASIPTPKGSVNRLRFITTTAKASLAAGDYAYLFQSLEGQKAADFMWGTPQARSIVVRFGWQSSIAGTFTFSLRSGAPVRTFCANFTVTPAQINTDIEVIIPIPGDVVANTWLNDENRFCYVQWVFAAGSNWQVGIDRTWTANATMATPQTTNGVAAVNNSFDVFDVGMYLDPDNTGVPPPWERPNETDELLRCRRYYAKYTAPFVASGYSHAAGQDLYNSFQFQTQMRINPAVSFPSPSFANTTAMVVGAVTVDGLRGSVNATAGVSGTGTQTYAIAPFVECNARI